MKHLSQMDIYSLSSDTVDLEIFVINKFLALITFVGPYNSENLNAQNLFGQ